MLKVALITLAFASQPFPHKLCGRSYTDRVQLLEQLKREKSVVHIAPYHNTYYWIDQDLLTVWWIHEGSAGPDIITCLRKWETKHDGYKDGRIESDCGTDKKSCQAQAHDMVGIKF